MQDNYVNMQNNYVNKPHAYVDIQEIYNYRSKLFQISKINIAHMRLQTFYIFMFTSEIKMYPI